MKAAEVLDAQGEIILAGDVRYFVKHCHLSLLIGKNWRRNSSDLFKSSVGLNRTVPSAGYLRTRS